MDSRLRLLLIGILIFAYIIIMAYFLFTYSPENGELVTDWPPAEPCGSENPRHWDGAALQLATLISPGYNAAISKR